MIGGFYSNDKGTSKLGIPYLSSIPIIGALFRSQSKSDVRRDLLIMITPTIVNANVALSPGENAPPATGAPATSTPTPGNGNIAKNAAEDVAKPKNSNSHNDAGDIGNASNTQAE